MKVIGLTGNSGSGKGTVADIMMKYGAYIIDCDRIAHINMAKGGASYGDIVSAFGREILDDNNEIDRKALGNIVFKDKNSLELLNSITHKHIVMEVEKNINNNRDKKAVIIDAPLLIEAGLDSICDSVWAVYAPVEIRLERVMERDNIDREKALLRFTNQMDFEEIKKRADIVICNDGSVDKLENVVFNIMNDERLI